jgi:hypothetical protein
MRPVRLAAVIALLAAASLLLAACGGSSTTTSTTTLGGGGSGETSTGEGGSMFDAATLDSALGAISDEIGSDARLSSFDLYPDHLTFLYQVDGGDTLAAYSMVPGDDTLSKASIIGSKKLKNPELETYDLSLVDSGAPARILEAAPKAAGVPGYKVSLMSLSPSLANVGEVEWSIVAEDTKDPGLLADADGTHVQNPLK